MDITQTLQKRFAEPLPENYRRRIIFWKDPEREFENQIEELDLDGVKIVKLTGVNNFAVKMLLSEDDPDSNYLVYDPLIYDETRENWLLDIELYSELFKADLVSIRMQELNIPDTPPLRQAVKGYAKFFASKDRSAKLKAFRSDYAASPAQLHLDALAVLTGAENNTSQAIMRAILSDDLVPEENEPLISIRKFGSEAVLWDLVHKLTGYIHGEEDTLLNLASHVLLSGLSVTMPAAALKGLEKFISDPHKEVCYAIVNEWLQTAKTAEQKESYYELARRVEAQLGLSERFDALDIEALWDSEVFPCIDECILRSFMTEISEDVVRADAITETVEKRRTHCWYERYENFYEGILQTAQMQRFCHQNSAAYHIASHEAFWKAYCENFYKMDQYYRRFNLAFGKNLKEDSTPLDDLFNNIADHVERLYKNNYLSALSAQWQILTKDEFSRSARLPGITRQEDFYMTFAQRIADTGQRVFVIISDGLRYEVAEELQRQLQRDTKGTSELKAVQAVFPSVTRFGMAVLLPHEKLQLSDTGALSCDGVSPDKTENRDKILKKYHPGNAAFISSDLLLKMNQKSRREAIADARCVYIYHNTIDALGDKPVTENRVFDACEDAVQEIKKLVKMIVNELSGTNIFITADHGFLYTRQPLEAWDKTDKGKVTGNVIDIGHRYVIAEPDCRADQMQRIPLNYLNSTLVGFTPPANVRIMTGSGGMNYVHGGISLQEFVVPVIEFKNKRPGSKNFVDMKKAELQLLSQTRKISNSMFTLNFYQKEPVGGKVSPAVYEIYLTDISGHVISDRQTVIADKTSENNNERTFRVSFTLKGLAFSKTETYSLLIREKETGLVTDRVGFNIDIAFTNDFDF